MAQPAALRSALPPNGARYAMPTAAWVVAGVAIVVRVGVALASHFTAEDYLITLRYAENLAAGLGLAYNPGERVLGTTTPLYTLFLALCAWAGLPATACGKALNVGADAVLCLVVFRWLDRLGRGRAGMMAACFLAVNPVSVRWSVSGMETSVATALGAWVWVAYAERRYRQAFVALGILFLVRWDSALIGAVLTGAVLVRERRIPWAGLGRFAALVAPWLAFAWMHYGNPIPVTGTAKMTVYGWRAGPDLLPQWGRLWFRLFGTVANTALTCLVVAGLARVYRARLAVLWPPVAWLVLYWCAFLLSKVLLFEWYVPPTLPVYAALLGLGAEVAWVRLTRGWRRSARLLLGLGVGVGIAANMTYLAGRVCRENQSIEDHLRRPLGLWLRAASRPGDRVMLEPIGYIGYYSRLRVLDTVGLVSPEILRYWRRSTGYPMREIALDARPEWLVLRPGELQHILDADRDGRWSRAYNLVRTFSYTPRPDRDLITFHVFRRAG